MYRVQSIAAVFIAFAVHVSPAAGQSHIWSGGYGGTETDIANAVAVDASGAFVVTGRCAGPVDFGGGTLTGEGGNTELFLVRYDAYGLHLWSRLFGGRIVEGEAVCVDASGNIIVTGGFVDTVDVGGGQLISRGSMDVFLAKYDADGNHLWSQRFGEFSFDRGLGLCVDGLDNIFITGSFAGKIDFGGGWITSVFDDIFLAKFTPAGTHTWSKGFGGTDDDIGRSVAVGASGDVYVTGYFEDSVDFGGGLMPSAGGDDIFLASFNTNGLHLWSQAFGDNRTDGGTDVAVDGFGNVLITGYFENTVDFGGGGLTSAGNADIFVAKYAAAGAHQWSSRYGNTDDDWGRGVRVDENNNLFITGAFRGAVDFGGGLLTSAGGTDIFLARYGSTGIHVWSQRFGSAGNDWGEGIAIGPANTVVSVGTFIGTVDFGGGPLTSAGGSDIYFAGFRRNDLASGAGSRQPVASLRQNTPNPFNPSTAIPFTLEKTGHVTLAIYDARGRHIRTLVDEVRNAGPHQARWDGTDASGSTVSSGVYFYRLKTGNTSLSKRMVLLK